jgi:hypothetical protein
MEENQSGDLCMIGCRPWAVSFPHLFQKKLDLLNIRSTFWEQLDSLSVYLSFSPLIKKITLLIPKNKKKKERRGPSSPMPHLLNKKIQ